MPDSPETRASLLVRLKDSADDAAWAEFTEIYRPLICRLARARGFQHADAEDLAQQVLTSVARAIGRWQAEPARARFRTWLTRVATNAMITALTRGPRDRGAGDSGIVGLLSNQPAESGAESELLRAESRREVFRWAARQIREEFHPVTWDAFWLTAVEGRSVDDVAQDMGRKRGSIYAARSRVMQRLREKVKEWEGD